MDYKTVTKVCFKCNQEKPLSDFYKHSQMGDGHLGKCKECTKADVHSHRKENIEKIREYDRKRGTNPDRIAKGVIRQRTYRANFPEKMTAHQKAERALACGIIERKACEVCGTEDRIEMHHEDYDNPLDVVFLCCMHHRRAHGMGLDYE